LEPGYHLTSGDIARLLQVDLKTVHNWFDRGYLTGRRTQGRHLRFARVEVARFLRVHDYPSSVSLGPEPPRVVVDAPAPAPSYVDALKRASELTVCDGLYRALLEAGTGRHEILVIDLDARNPAEVEKLIEAVRAWPSTSSLCLIGVSAQKRKRSAFLAQGGDVAWEPGAGADLKGLVRWAIGATRQLPPKVEVAGPDAAEEAPASVGRRGRARN
jgi:hypothetical protein